MSRHPLNSWQRCYLCLFKREFELLVISFFERPNGSFFLLIPHSTSMHIWFKNHFYICGCKCFPRKVHRISLGHIWYTFHCIQKLSVSNTAQISSLTLLMHKSCTVVWGIDTSAECFPRLRAREEALLFPGGRRALDTYPHPPSPVSAQDAELSVYRSWARPACRSGRSLCSLCAPTWPLLPHYKSTCAAPFSVTADHFWTFSQAIHYLLSITSFNWLNYFHCLHS